MRYFSEFTSFIVYVYALKRLPHGPGYSRIGWHCLIGRAKETFNTSVDEQVAVVAIRGDRNTPVAKAYGHRMAVDLHEV